MRELIKVMRLHDIYEDVDIQNFMSLHLLITGSSFFPEILKPFSFLKKKINHSSS